MLEKQLLDCVCIDATERIYIYISAKPGHVTHRNFFCQGFDRRCVYAAEALTGERWPWAEMPLDVH